MAGKLGGVDQIISVSICYEVEITTYMAVLSDKFELVSARAGGLPLIQRREVVAEFRTSG